MINLEIHNEALLGDQKRDESSKSAINLDQRYVEKKNKDQIERSKLPEQKKEDERTRKRKAQGLGFVAPTWLLDLAQTIASLLHSGRKKTLFRRKKTKSRQCF